MMPRNPRRSSILKPPKQVLRSPLQDLDNNDEGTLMQPNSRRVSFSRTSNIKEFEPSLGCATKWNPNDEDSLESIEGDENQPKSANGFDEPSSVQTQKKPKRKRTPTMQSSLNSSNIETISGLSSDLNQSLQQSPCARVIKQPRKSLNCSKADILEEGDTTLFFDELNLTEPIKCSYSNVDMSTNLTRTLIDSVLDYSDADLCGSRIDLSEGCSSEHSSKSIGSDFSKTLSCNDEVFMEDVFSSKVSVLNTESDMNGDLANKCESLNITDNNAIMESALPSEDIEVANMEECGVIHHDPSEKLISNIDLPVAKSDIEHENSTNTSVILSDNDCDDRLPIPSKDTHLNDSNECSVENGSLLTSTELTIPQLRSEDLMPESCHKEGNIQVAQCIHYNDLETEDLEMMGALGNIARMRISESRNVNDNVKDEVESLTNVLYSNEGCVEFKHANSTVNSDVEISVSNAGITFEENIERQGLNSTNGSDDIVENSAEIGVMDLTIPLENLKMSEVRGDLEKIDTPKSSEATNLLNSPNSTLEGVNEDVLLKVMAERNSVEGIVNTTYDSEGLDETCADMYGMEMTVSLGKIREKIPTPIYKNATQQTGGIDNFASGELLKNEVLPGEVLKEVHNNIAELNMECQTTHPELHNNAVTNHGECQEMNETKLEAGMMSITNTSHEEQCEDISDNMESSPQVKDENNPEVIGKDITGILETSKEEYGDPLDSFRSPNSGIIGIDLTIPLGEGEFCVISGRTGSLSPMVNATSPGSVRMKKTLPLENIYQESLDNSVAESHLVNHANLDGTGRLKEETLISEKTLDPLEEFEIQDTNPDEIDMGLTVPLESLKGDKHENSVDNLLKESQIKDETVSHTMCMELTIPLGRLKGEMEKNHVDNIPLHTHILNDTHPDVVNIDMTFPEGKSNRVEIEISQNAVDSVIDNAAEPQILHDIDILEQTVPIVEGNVNLTVNTFQQVDTTNPDAMSVEMSLAEEELQGETSKDGATKSETLNIETELKGSNISHEDNILMELKQIDDTNPDFKSETSILQGKSKGVVSEDYESESVVETQMVDVSASETVEMESAPPVEELKTGNTDFADGTIAESQQMDDVNSDELGMELNASLESLKGDKHETSRDSLLRESQIMDETILPSMCMDLTIPLGRLKSRDPVDNPLLQTKIMNESHNELMNVEITSPGGRSEGVEGQNAEDSMVNNMVESHILHDSNLEAFDLELSVPMAKENASLTVNVVAESQQVDNTNPDEMSVKCIPQLELNAVIVEDNMTESVAECQVVDSANFEPVEMESKAPIAELKERNIGHADNTTESQKIDDTIPNEMGMEFTIPVGISKEVKVEVNQCIENTTINITAKSQNTNLEAVGEEPSVTMVEDENLIANVIAETQRVDVNPDAVGVEMFVIQEDLQAVTGEDHEGESIAEGLFLGDTNSETLEMELAELKGVSHGDSTITGSLQIDDTNSDEIVMELISLESSKEDPGRAHALELQVVDVLSPDTGDMELAVPLVSLGEEKVLQSCDDNVEEPLAECETSIRDLEVGKLEEELESTVSQVDNKCQIMDATSTNSMDRQLFISSGGQDCGSLFDDNATKPILKDGMNEEEVGVEFNVALSIPGEPVEGDPTPYGSPECNREVETISTGVESEPNIPLGSCDEKIIQEEAVEGQRDEEIIPEHEEMEQSLSETILDELQVANTDNTEFEQINETINEDELMVMGTPIKRPESTKVSQSPVHNIVKLELLDIEYSSSDANEISDEYDVNPILSLEDNEQQIEKSTSEGQEVDCDEFVCDIDRLPTETESNTETDVTLDKQVQTNSDGTCAEMVLTVPLGKLKSHEEVNEMAVSFPSQADDDINCSTANSSNDVAGQYALVNASSIFNNESGAVSLEVVPAMDSALISGFANEDRSHGDPSLGLVNTLEIHSEELVVECVPFFERDSLIANDDCVEPMDESYQENLKPGEMESSCEIKAVHHYELETDCRSRDESGECLIAHELSYMEETCSITADTCDSSVVDIAASDPIQEESSKSLVSVEDWIKEESSKKPCSWTTYKLLENQYSFVVFHESVTLIVNLEPLLDHQNSKDNRIVESILLKSCITDDYDRCLQVVLNVMLKRLSSSLLCSKCSSTEQLPSLFDFLNSKFLAMNLLLLQTYDLMRASPAKLRNDGLSFMVVSVERLLLFEVQVNLLNWDKDGVKPDDIQVKNIIGKIGVSSIQSIVQSVKCDEQYFQNIYAEVLNFISTQEQILE